MMWNPPISTHKEAAIPGPKDIEKFRSLHSQLKGFSVGWLPFGVFNVALLADVEGIQKETIKKFVMVINGISEDKTNGILLA